MFFWKTLVDWEVQQIKEAKKVKPVAKLLRKWSKELFLLMNRKSVDWWCRQTVIWMATTFYNSFEKWIFINFSSKKMFSIISIEHIMVISIKARLLKLLNSPAIDNVSTWKSIFESFALWSLEPIVSWAGFSKLALCNQFFLSWHFSASAVEKCV